MGTKEKLIERFLTLPKNFTYDEVKRLFGLFGYSEGKKGNTSGSRVEFISADNKSSYIMHKPHPSNIIKGYVMKQLLAYIRENNEEDNCLFGKVLGLKKDCITYEGETISELKSDFEGAIDDYLASCKDRGVEPSKPYSGKLVLRMPSDLHGMVATAAANAGTTINEFINRAVTKELEKEFSM